MCDAAGEERIGGGCRLVHVGVRNCRRVKVAKMFDVVERESGGLSVRRVWPISSSPKRIRKGCSGPSRASSKPAVQLLVMPVNRSGLPWMAVRLHVMHDAPDAAHLLAAAGAPGSAVDHVGQGRAVAGRFLARISGWRNRAGRDARPPSPARLLVPPPRHA